MAAEPNDAEIVIGLDRGRSAATALRWAAEQSRVTGMPLRIVHAWQMGPVEVPPSGRLWEAANADARACATRRVIETLSASANAVRWILEVVEGSPGPVLVRHSHGARLLVLGSREHAGSPCAVPGSVTDFCLSHAEPPVVSVPAAKDPAVTHALEDAS
jgi:nucleotide-binding universal stress UspA family protein